MDEKLFKQFAKNNQLNEGIAVALEYTHHLYNPIEGIHPDLWANQWKDKDGFLRKLPQWDKDKNLWTEGSEVVEFMREEKLHYRFVDKVLINRYKAIDTNDWKDIGSRTIMIYHLMSLPAYDYAQTLVDMIGETL